MLSMEDDDDEDEDDGNGDTEISDTLTRGSDGQSQINDSSDDSEEMV